MSNQSSKKMKGLVEAAAMMAGGSGSSLSSPTTDQPSATKATIPPMLNSPPPTSDGKTHAKDANAARARRLEQNRRAAIESRRRKKVMIAELQKSVAFYTKANESIKMDNHDLEQKLLIAKRRAMQVNAGIVPSSLTSEQVASNSIKSNLKGGPVETDQILAQLSATKALCDAMGYPPPGNTSVAASPTSTDPTRPGAGATELMCHPSLDNKTIGSEDDVAGDEYVQSLKKFAMHQAAAASAAAAAANAAIQALNWHNIMKVQPPPSSAPVLPASTQEGEVFPLTSPIKKQKLL